MEAHGIFSLRLLGRDGLPTAASHRLPRFACGRDHALLVFAVDVELSQRMHVRRNS